MGGFFVSQPMSTRRVRSLSHLANPVGRAYRRVSRRNPVWREAETPSQPAPGSSAAMGWDFDHSVSDTPVGREPLAHGATGAPAIGPPTGPAARCTATHAPCYDAASRGAFSSAG